MQLQRLGGKYQKDEKSTLHTAVMAFLDITPRGGRIEKYLERRDIARSKAGDCMHALSKIFAWPSDDVGLFALEAASLSDGEHA